MEHHRIQVGERLPQFILKIVHPLLVRRQRERGPRMGQSICREISGGDRYRFIRTVEHREPAPGQVSIIIGHVQLRIGAQGCRQGELCRSATAGFRGDISHTCRDKSGRAVHCSCYTAVGSKGKFPGFSGIQCQIK